MGANLANNIKSKSRNSSIELIKIIAILMIVLSHSIPVNVPNSLYALNIASADIQHLIANIFRYLGQVGNAIFVVSSAWFLVDSKKVNGKKLLYIYGDCFVFSMLWLGIALFLLDYDISAKELIKQFFPVTFQLNWFICCYIMLYAIHPLLNKIICSITKETHLLICITAFILYCVISEIKGELYFYNNLIGFIMLYFLTAYIKLYLKELSANKKVSIGMMLTGAIGSILLFAALELAGLHIGFLSNKITHFSNFTNPCCLLFVFGLFCYAKEHSFVSKPVNYLSGLSLIIYIFHENYFVYFYLRNDIFKIILEKYTFNHFIPWVIIVAILTLIISVAVSALYQSTIKRLVVKICNLLADFIESVYKKVSGILLKLN